jgi:hypothetical protein
MQFPDSSLHLSRQLTAFVSKCTSKNTYLLLVDDALDLVASTAAAGIWEQDDFAGGISRGRAGFAH